MVYTMFDWLYNHNIYMEEKSNVCLISWILIEW